LRILRTKPYLRQRLRNRISRGWRPYIYALVLWSAWAIASLILRTLLGEDGLLYSMILFGGIAFVSIVYVAQWLRNGIRRDRYWEAGVKQENEFMLNAFVSPRRPLPAWESYMASAELLECIWQLILEERPNRVLELGSGLSTLVMAYALEAAGQGTLCSLEDHAGYAARTRRLVREHGLDAYAEVIETRLERLTVDSDVPYWYALTDLSTDMPIDLLFVDGPSGHFHPKIRYPALPVLRNFLSDNAVVIVDDSHRWQESDMIHEWLAEYPELRIDGDFVNPYFTVLRLSRSNVNSRAHQTGVRETSPVH